IETFSSLVNPECRKNNESGPNAAGGEMSYQQGRRFVRRIDLSSAGFPPSVFSAAAVFLKTGIGLISSPSAIVSAMKRSLVATSLLALVLVADPVATFAQAVHRFDYPKSYAVLTDARGISNSGEIAGQFSDRFYTPYGFTLTPGSFFSRPIIYQS